MNLLPFPSRLHRLSFLLHLPAQLLDESVGLAEPALSEMGRILHMGRVGLVGAFAYLAKGGRWKGESQLGADLALL